MRCPFLHEAEVESCRCAPVRKMIISMPGSAEPKCSTAGYATCPVYQQHSHNESTGSRCPYLDHSLVQYCAASSPQKFIPYSDSLLSRCGSSRYRYCDLYLMLAEAGERVSEPEVEGIRVPRHLRFAPNHMWLEADEQGWWHVGIDGFAARVLGRIDGITYVTEKGTLRPAVVLNAHGADLSFVFPCPLPVQAVNTYLRGTPAKLETAPYTLGWMFEGQLPNGFPAGALLTYPESAEWMRQEVDRLSRFVHAEAGESADGGVFEAGVCRHLSRESILRLFNDFFSPYASSL